MSFSGFFVPSFSFAASAEPRTDPSLLFTHACFTYKVVAEQISGCRQGIKNDDGWCTELGSPQGKTSIDGLQDWQLGLGLFNEILKDRCRITNCYMIK